MIELTNEKDSLLKYLPSMGVVELTPNTCLIGHDSWYDCRFGDYWNSHFELSDFDLIEDIKYLKSKLDRYSFFTKLGDDCADYIKETFPKAAAKYKNIIYCQHVPPFEEASLYMGKRSSHLSMPFFSCKASGVALSEMGRAYPKVKIACLTAHTHDKAFFKKDNINVYVAGAQYYYPTVYATLDLK